MSNRQFGFMKGRSTVDGIELAIEVVNKARTGSLSKSVLRYGLFRSGKCLQYGVLGQNETLVVKRVSLYLARILRSYLTKVTAIWGNRAPCFHKFHPTKTGPWTNFVERHVQWTTANEDTRKYKRDIDLNSNCFRWRRYNLGDGTHYLKSGRSYESVTGCSCERDG